MDYSKTHKYIVKEFNQKKIPIKNVWFYDHPNFIRREQICNDYLNTYARFVQTKKYEKSYLEIAEKKIRLISQILFGELSKDGRLGACVDLAIVFSRILDKHGIWNYCAKGSLTIEYPDQPHLHSSHFPHCHNDIENKVGHTWLVAPPFQVVDCTAKLQPYSYDEVNFLPEIVYEKNKNYCQADISDLYDSNVISQFMANGQGLNMNIFYGMFPYLRKFCSVFKANCISLSDVKMKYVPCGITFSDKPLEKIKGLELSGKLGYEIYEDIILPELNKLQSG